jgi:Tol biopolymer transport system component
MLPAPTFIAMTTGRGPDVSPTWNRKTGAQIAFVSGSTGLPQVYTMEADGTNQQRMTDQGYAVSPNWSPERPISHPRLDPQVWSRRAGLF